MSGCSSCGKSCNSLDGPEASDYGLARFSFHGLKPVRIITEEKSELNKQFGKM